MGQFKKGNDPRRNTKGRPVGKPNKTVEELRGFLQAFIEKNTDRLQKDFDALKPVERLNFFNSLLKHVLPGPPSPETLTETQLEQLVEYLKKKYND